MKSYDFYAAQAFTKASDSREFSTQAIVAALLAIAVAIKSLAPEVRE